MIITNKIITNAHLIKVYGKTVNILQFVTNYSVRKWLTNTLTNLFNGVSTLEYVGT